MQIATPELKVGPADAILMAMKMIMVNGWVRGALCTEDGYCITGAIVAATSDMDVQERAFESIRLECGCQYITRWNDEIARSKKQVVDMLARAARRTRQVRNLFAWKKKLPCGRFFLIDDEDEPLLAGRIWFSRKGATSFYVRGRAPGVGNPEIGLQRLILGLEDGERCSFKNLNGLDCRRSNLVRCTQAEVSMHMRKKRSYKTYKGVFWDGRVSRFYAQLALDNGRPASTFLGWSS